jgi:hypothetical protein
MHKDDLVGFGWLFRNSLDHTTIANREPIMIELLINIAKRNTWTSQWTI